MWLAVLLIIVPLAWLLGFRMGCKFGGESVRRSIMCQLGKRREAVQR